MDGLKDHLQNAFKKAEIEARMKGKKYKKNYDQEASTSLLMPGDRVLVQKKGVQGNEQIGDIWENSPYLVKKQPMPNILVYVVQKENSNRKPRFLHRNMLLPFNGLQRPEDENIDHKRPQHKQIPTPVMIEPSYSESSSDSSREDDYGQLRKEQPRKDIPTRRGRAPSSTNHHNRPATCKTWTKKTCTT